MAIRKGASKRTKQVCYTGFVWY